jgi:hypothetical protein
MEMSAVQNFKFKGVEINGVELQKLLERCWTINDMVEKFRVSGMTIHNWRNFRGLPAVVIAGEVRPALRFMPHEVVEWAKTNNVTMYDME